MFDTINSIASMRKRGIKRPTNEALTFYQICYASYMGVKNSTDDVVQWPDLSPPE
jgi:hypothetical protein